MLYEWIAKCANDATLPWIKQNLIKSFCFKGFFSKVITNDGSKTSASLFT